MIFAHGGFFLSLHGESGEWPASVSCPASAATLGA